LIGNPAPLQFTRLEENVKVDSKVEKAVGDKDAKVSSLMNELHGSNVSTEGIIRLLSAGLLGTKLKRKLVPTRWAITSVDSNVSSHLIDQIKYYPPVSGFQVFHSEYLGNHYEIILMPRQFSFEVIEGKMPGSIWNPGKDLIMLGDFESWYGRKDYASNVGGEYYAVRLPVSEHLSKIRKQASVLVLRECRKAYYAPCGVGVLREIVRDALSRKPECFDSIGEALDCSKKRMIVPMNIFREKSRMLSEIKFQRKLSI